MIKRGEAHTRNYSIHIILTAWGGMYENEKDDGKYFVNSNNFSDQGNSIYFLRL